MRLAQGLLGKNDCPLQTGVGCRCSGLKPAHFREELLARYCHSDFIVKPRAQPGHKEHEGESMGATGSSGRPRASWPSPVPPPPAGP